MSNGIGDENNFMHKKIFILLTLSFLSFSKPLLGAPAPWVKVEDTHKLPSFSEMDAKEKKELLLSIEESLSYLNRKSSKYHFPKQGISHQKVKKSLERFKELLKLNLTAKQLDEKIKKEFDIYKSVGKEDKKKVLFTGYFEPIYQGSLKPTETYRYPLYKTPPDLVLNSSQKVLGRKTKSGRVVPKYWTRQDIDNHHVLKGKNLELVYLDNPYRVYQAQFQGSVAVHLENGEVKRYGYSARNCSTVGFSLPKELLKAQVFKKNELLPDRIADYFHQYPEELSKYLKNNPSYVFFVERKRGPMGALSVMVRGEKAISTDHRLFPKAALAFVDLKLYKNKKNHPFRHFVLNQDTGGAVMGPGRCEIFFGTGEKAKEKASDMFSYGDLYFFFLKD